MPLWFKLTRLFTPWSSEEYCLCQKLPLVDTICLKFCSHNPPYVCFERTPREAGRSPLIKPERQRLHMRIEGQPCLKPPSSSPLKSLRDLKTLWRRKRGELAGQIYAPHKITMGAKSSLEVSLILINLSRSWMKAPEARGMFVSWWEKLVWNLVSLANVEFCVVERET